MMTIKEANSRYESLLNGGKENYNNLRDMSKSFIRSARATINYEKQLIMYSRSNKCNQMLRLMDMDGMLFCSISDLESVLN